MAAMASYCHWIICHIELAEMCSTNYCDIMLYGIHG